MHIRYFIGYVYHICLQDTIQSTLSLCLRCQAMLLPMPLRPLLLTTRSGFTISMTDLLGFFTHSLPHHTTHTSHTQTHTMSHLIIPFVLFGCHTLRNCCSTTSLKFLPTSQFLSHFLRVDSQCPLTGAGIGLTPPRLCCVTQVNRFKLGHFACYLANAFRDVLLKSPTPVATETSGALR